MILAAGLGTRLGEYTSNKPKALVEVENAPLLEHVLHRLIRQGFTDIIINVHHFAKLIRDFVVRNKNFGINIQFSHEDFLLDTGGGLKHASWFFDDENPFLMCNVDVLTNLDLQMFMNFHVQNNCLATVAVRQRETQRYILFDETNQLVGWESIATGEKIVAKRPVGELTRLSFMGVHAFSPQIFLKMNNVGVFSIIQAYIDLAKQGEKIIGYRGDAAKWLDLGRIEIFQRAKSILGDDFFTSA